MATLHWQRDLTSDVNGVKNTYSSWDNCMAKAYCKWPAIVGIIIGSLIVLSLLTCLFRCLCCGAECCCGCLSCCNACCPSPRRAKQKEGYEPPPPRPYQQPYQQPSSQPYPQYQSAPSPKYAAGGYRGPQTATFEGPSRKSAQPPAPFNEDALPAMPGWDTAVSKHVEEEPEDVEMEKLESTTAHQYAFGDQNDARRYHGGQSPRATGNAGAASAVPYPEYGQQPQRVVSEIRAGPASPYHHYDQHQQFVPSPVSSAPTSTYPPTYHTSPTGTAYPSNQHWDGAQGYAPSVPPSYRTGPPSIASPLLQRQSFGTVGRKPVQGSWREV